jgi:hypothetical protein
MRKPLLALLAATAMLPAPALAQREPAASGAAARTATGTTPRLELTAEQRTELRQAVMRGRALAVLDQAGRVSTRDMLARVPAADRGALAGWIAQPEGNGVTVTYFSREGEGFAAVYRSQMLGGRITSPQVFPAGSRPALTGPAARMAAARMAAEGLQNRPCGPEFNYLVLPPEGQGPVLVYQMSPRTAAAKVPVGGHFRTAIGADGAVVATAPLSGACQDLTLARVPAGQRPRPLPVSAPDMTLPNELHVFLALWTGRPIAVATGSSPTRLWGVTGDGIAELQQ